MDRRFLIVALLGLLTAVHSFRLKAIMPAGRVMLGLAFTSVFAIHGVGLIWADERPT